MERLYTIIVDYKGGTYVSQYNSLDILDLKNKWLNIELPKLKDIAGFSPNEINLIKEKLMDEKEICFEGLSNVWNNDLGFISEDYFSFIIVATLKE
ncbi:hypothetical protein [Chryseobacterium sp. Marseille-Q3244]|uniref:hypothetical protein n=1 Tax=Chryseobacterium sp. Marseille-Q3244 TaxID=2758092 RepID=UPI002024BC86|nr:hypothetical protein [Chryseobacterium sp. Marseille-Q3244]